MSCLITIAARSDVYVSVHGSLGDDDEAVHGDLYRPLAALILIRQRLPTTFIFLRFSLRAANKTQKSSSKTVISSLRISSQRHWLFASSPQQVETRMSTSGKLTDWVKPGDSSGEFKRQVSSFRESISSEAGAKFPVEKGRYHLYISYACPWVCPFCQSLVSRRGKRVLTMFLYMTIRRHGPLSPGS